MRLRDMSDDKPTLELPTLEHPTLELSKEHASPDEDPAASITDGARLTVDDTSIRHTVDSHDPLPADVPPSGPTAEVTAPPRATVVALVGIILFAAVTGPLIFYFFFFRYQPTAIFHIPDNAQMAIRFDTRQLYSYPPFRSQVLGALAIQEQSQRRAAFKKHTGIDLGSDVREVVVASMDGKSHVVLLGGYFQKVRRGTFVGGLQAFMSELGSSSVRESDTVLLLPSGQRISQADDSTIVLGSDASVFTAALPASNEPSSLSLPASGAISVAFGPAAFERATQLDVPALADVARHASRAAGFFTLGRRNKFYLEFVPRRIGAEELTAKLETARTFLADDPTSPLPDAAARLLRAGRTKSRAEAAMFEVEVADDTLEQGFAAMTAIAVATLAAPR